MQRTERGTLKRVAFGDEAPEYSARLEWTRAARALVIGCLSLAAAAGGAAELPAESGDRHFGVKTCSGTPCHGSVAAIGRVVGQNEHTIWTRKDAHARAWDVLSNAQSRRIARNLGMAEDASAAARCLDCHADNVPPERRGEQFALEDGVGCEACHGGSERWLHTHASGNGDHADNVRLGLYPMDDPRRRAELCLSCHFGNEKKFVDHRLLAAGHPRLTFELDTFTEIQPRHFQVDADWRKRGKATPPRVRVWALGQASEVRSVLVALLDPERGREGPWPEFALFDCHACHRPTSSKRWAPRRTTGLGLRPGLPRLDDSRFLMLYQAMRAIDGDSAEDLRAATLALHSALSRGRGDLATAGRRALELSDHMLDRAERWNADGADLRAILIGLTDDGLSGQYRDYVGAEQAAMAIQVMRDALAESGSLRPADRAQIDDAIDRLLEATQDDDGFRPRSLESPLRELRQALHAAAP